MTVDTGAEGLNYINTAVAKAYLSKCSQGKRVIVDVKHTVRLANGMRVTTEGQINLIINFTILKILINQTNILFAFKFILNFLRFPCNL